MTRLLFSALVVFTLTAGLAKEKAKSKTTVTTVTKSAGKSSGKSASSGAGASGGGEAASLTGSQRGRGRVRGIRPGRLAGAADSGALYQLDFIQGCLTFSNTYFHAWGRPYLESTIHSDCTDPTLVLLTLYYYDAAGVAYRSSVAYINLAAGVDWQFYYEEKRSARLKRILITSVTATDEGTPQ